MGNANAASNVVRAVLPICGGDQLVSMIQGVTRGRRPEIGAGAGTETVKAALAAVYDLVKAISAVATSERNSPDQTAGYERLRKAPGSVVLSSTDVAGLPVSPLARIGGNVYNSATRVAEDPRKGETTSAIRAGERMARGAQTPSLELSRPASHLPDIT